MSKTSSFACILALLGLLQGCKQPSPRSGSTAVPAADQPQTAKGLWADMLIEEECMPPQYLEATGASYRTPQGQLVLQGHLVSTATFASYKNPVILVTWFAKDYTKLGVKRYPVQVLLRAQETAPFRLITQAPRDVVSVGLDIASAAVSQERSPNGLL